MKRLMMFINRPTKTNEQEHYAEESNFSIPTHPQRARHHHDHDTRPTYRIGNHKPSDIQKAIDLAG